MDLPSRLRRTILCLPFFFCLGDRAHAAQAPALQAGDAAGAQRASVSTQGFAQCGELELILGQQPYRITCDRMVVAPGVRHWDGHVAGSAGHKLSFQIRPEGATGLLDLPGRPLRLGLVDGVQWLLDTPAEQLQAELADIPPPLFVLRETATDSGAAAGVKSSDADRTRPGEPAFAGKPADVAYPVALNLADLAAVEPGGQVDLALPGLQQNVTYEKTLVSPTGTSTWIGYLTQYGRDYPVVLTYSVDGSTTGAIQGPTGEWLVSGKPGETWLIDTASSGLRHNPTAKDDDAVAPPTAAGHAEAFAAGATAATGSAGTPTASADTSTGNTVVDVLVLYTPGLVSRYGGEAGAANRIDYFISLANQAYSNGNVGITLRRVGLQRVDIADNTSNSTTLGQLRSGSGAFASIPALRNSTGADGVLLVRPFDMNGQGGNCGVGYVGGYGGTPMSAYADYAYAVVSEGKDVKGQSYYCTDTTFAHELGHNMGLMHDRETVARQGGGSGALPYAYGYGKSGQFGTIMSYIYPVVVRFSNPLDMSCNGTACGVSSSDAASSADNARALGITRAPFSAFRATTTAGRVSIAGVITIDGKAAANVGVLANGATCATSNSTGMYACSFDSGWSGTISASAGAVTFAPQSASYNNLQSSEARNFAGVSTAAPVTIGGVVRINGVPVAGVKVTATGATCSLTNAAGGYSCNLMSHGSGTVSASFLGTTFSPASIAFNNIVARLTANFSGTRPAIGISGRVTVKGRARAGVAVKAGDALCSVTNSSGAYACSRLKGWSGRLAVPQLGSAVYKEFSNLVAPLRFDFVIR
ncbi:MAG: hypothetical protein IPL03_09695 [Sterolibacteriaceae bacterium]|nr:hypothetical protein [Candidatus Methylophosphatis haderslevensis]